MHSTQSPAPGMARRGSIRPRRTILGRLWLLLALVPAVKGNPDLEEDTSGGKQIAPAILKSLSLEELSQIEVTTPSKQPVKVFQTPSAIFVLTGEDIRRSGANTIPAALRLVPGVEVVRPSPVAPVGRSRSDRKDLTEAFRSSAD